MDLSSPPLPRLLVRFNSNIFYSSLLDFHVGLVFFIGPFKLCFLCCENFFCVTRPERILFFLGTGKCWSNEDLTFETVASFTTYG